MTRILLMRHGHSVANQKGLIISDPNTGCFDYGLTSQGKREVKEALNLYQDCLSTVTKIVSSDFLRTLETAKIISNALLIPLKLESDLRERFFLLPSREQATQIMMLFGTAIRMASAKSKT